MFGVYRFIDKNTKWTYIEESLPEKDPKNANVSIPVICGGLGQIWFARYNFKIEAFEDYNTKKPIKLSANRWVAVPKEYMPK